MFFIKICMVLVGSLLWDMIDGPGSGQGQAQAGTAEAPRHTSSGTVEALAAQVRHLSIFPVCYYLGILRYVMFHLKANKEVFASCVQIKQVMSSMD
jgi:hypothetical protein